MCSTLLFYRRILTLSTAVFHEISEVQMYQYHITLSSFRKRSSNLLYKTGRPFIFQKRWCERIMEVFYCKCQTSSVPLTNLVRAYAERTRNNQHSYSKMAICQKRFNETCSNSEKISSVVAQELSKLWWPVACRLQRVFSNLLGVTFRNIFDTKILVSYYSGEIYV